MHQLRTCEEVGCTVRAGRDAGAATDAGCEVEGQLSYLMADGGVIRIHCGTRVDRHVSTGLDDVIQGRTINHQIPYHREGC